MELGTGPSELLSGTPRRSDLAYEAIRSAIASGQIRPGKSLRQKALANELGVSQVTIREAFSRLIAEGFLVHEPYRGVRTIILPPDDQRDLLEIRAHLEGMAAKLAATRLQDQDLSRMSELLLSTVVTEDPDSAGPAWEANREFHWIFIQACGRRHLERVLGQIWDLTNHYLLLSRLPAEKRLQIATCDLEEHEQLLARLQARDGPGARRVTMKAIERALQTVLGLMVP